MKIRIGIDEVGRGCLAGPVTVCAVLMTGNFHDPKNLPKLRDSKCMSPIQRREWYGWIKENGKRKGIKFSVSSVSPKMVDRINIAQAANLAAWRSFQKIMSSIDIDGESTLEITLDGGLFLKNRIFQKNLDRKTFSVKTVVRADETFKEVKIASVMAKVSRDAKMTRVAKKYPEYGFALHKGYGTKTHMEAIKNSGTIEGFHRETFLSGIRSRN